MALINFQDMILYQEDAPVVDRLRPLLQCIDTSIEDLSRTCPGRKRAAGYGAELAKLLSHPDGQVRGAAAWAIGELDLKQYVDKVAALLDDNSILPDGIIQAVGQLGGKRYAGRIIKYLESSDGGTRFLAGDALAAMNAIEYTEDIRRLLGHKDGGVRAAAAVALVRLQPRDHLNTIISLLDDPDDYARSMAATTLRELADPRAIPAIRKVIAREENDFIRYDLECALKKAEAKSNRR